MFEIKLYGIQILLNDIFWKLEICSAKKGIQIKKMERLMISYKELRKRSYEISVKSFNLFMI